MTNLEKILAELPEIKKNGVSMAQELSEMSKRIDSLESKKTVKAVKFARSSRTLVGASANGGPMGLSMPLAI